MSRSFFPIVFVLVFQVAGFPLAAEETVDRPSAWVNPVDCEALLAHQPDASVEYQAGVDATGRPVAPADLPGHEPLEIGTGEVAIELRIPLSEFYAAPASLQPLIGDAEIDPGRVTVRDGVAYLGEHRLTSQDQNAIARACAERL